MRLVYFLMVFAVLVGGYGWNIEFVVFYFCLVCQTLTVQFLWLSFLDQTKNLYSDVDDIVSGFERRHTNTHTMSFWELII